MKVEVWAPIITALIAAVSAILIALIAQRQSRRDVRSNIRADLEILQHLKEGQPEHERLHGHVAARIESLVGHESEARRDSVGIASALILWMVGAALFASAIVNDGWWWLAGAFGIALILFGFVGLPDFEKKVRDQGPSQAGVGSTQRKPAKKP